MNFEMCRSLKRSPTVYIYRCQFGCIKRDLLMYKETHTKRRFNETNFYIRRPPKSAQTVNMYRSLCMHKRPTYLKGDPYKATLYWDVFFHLLVSKKCADCIRL